MHHGDMSDDKRSMRLEWRNHMLMRVLIGLIVLIFVFWCGMQLGELRSAVGLARGGAMQGGWSQMGGGMRMHTMIPAGDTTAVPATTGAAAQ